MSTHQLQKAPVVAVLNMKGGVGKTTISGSLFRELYKHLSAGGKTLLIDFDAQFNLTQLVLNQTDYETFQTEGKTIWHVLEPNAPGGVFETSDGDLTKVKGPLDYSVLLKRTVNNEHEFYLLPGDFQLAALNLRENQETLNMPRKRFKHLIEQARASCALVVLDCNPSSSFLTRCAIENATHVLVPVRPDKYSVLGLKMLNNYMDQLPDLAVKPEIFIILNGVGKVESQIESEIRGHKDYGPRTLVARIRQSAILTARADYTGFGADRKVAHSATVRSQLKVAGLELAKKLHLKI